jgi:F420-non-reducing hydrogenase small subunit
MTQPATSNGKPRVAFYWCAACGGCEEAVVDLAEKLLDVVAAVDIVFWPVALDFKRADVEAMPSGSLLASFINGAIRTSEQLEMAELLRSKSRVVVAFGACAQLGGIPGLANFYERESILATVYQESPSTTNPDAIRPQLQMQVNGHALTLPVFDDTVRSLDQVIDVDYYVPGCPPMPKVIAPAVQTLLSGELPPKGAILAPDKALCEECPRRDSKPEDLALTEFKRPHEFIADEQKCLLAQGVLCLGAATRAGCDAACVHGNMPCTGCGGPTSRVRDQGAKALSAIASVLAAQDEQEIDRVLAAIPDPAGTLYRYSLPASLLRRTRVALLHPEQHAGTTR